MRRAALLLLLAATGCQTFTSSYWDDVKTGRVAASAASKNEEHVHFLGVRVSDTVSTYQVGVKLLHVFGASPAARAGLEPGDELRSLDGVPVRTASEVKSVLAATQGVDRETVPMVYWRDGQEYPGTIDLVTWHVYREARRQRIFADPEFGESEFPFFFRDSTRSLTPQFLLLYYGVRVNEPVLVYSDFTLFPLIPGVAVFRRESFPLVDGSRTQVWHWPFRFTTAGDDRTSDLHDLVPPPPPDTSDL